MNTLGSDNVSNIWRAYFISPHSQVQQDATILFCRTGLDVSPVLIVWEWICLSWSMDLQVSKREAILLRVEECKAEKVKCK